MYPLAQILHSQGYFLTGSDNNETETLDAVRKMGIEVFIGQRAENIKGADLIVFSAAIMDDNPELVASRESGVPVLERSELLGIVTSWYSNAVCVSGTHGKTTTTSMLTQVFRTADVDISAVIGGKLDCIGGSGRAGSSDVMICESCEFRDTFLRLFPDIAVILNVDADHLDYFGNLENIISSFHKFAENASKCIIVNGTDANSMKSIEGITGKEIITFGSDSSCDFYPENVKHENGLLTTYDAMYKGEKLGTVTLHVAGIHNVLNSLATVAAAHYLGLDFSFVQQGLADFKGAKRRFEKLGYEKGITVVDDYAHHPTELEATLNAAMEMNFGSVWAIFQPFTFSRTKILLDDFARVLTIPDHIVLTDIMGSREKNTYGIFTRHLAEKIPGCIWFPQDEGAEWTDERKYENFRQICDYVCENAKPGDLVITLGCGDAYKISKMILKKLSEEK